MRILRGKMIQFPEVAGIHELIEQARGHLPGRPDDWQARPAPRPSCWPPSITPRSTLQRLQQVFWNLDQERLEVHTRPAARSRFARPIPEPGPLLVEVIDTGIGIDPDVLFPASSTPFEQGATSPPPAASSVAWAWAWPSARAHRRHPRRDPPDRFQPRPQSRLKSFLSAFSLLPTVAALAARSPTGPSPQRASPRLGTLDPP